MVTTLEALDDAAVRHGRPGWWVTAVVTGLAFALRLVGLGSPHAVLFDETYYAKDAWGVVTGGYERNWADGADDLLLRGDLSGMRDDAAFVVHPPLGKLLIGWGEQAFGMNPFGWRITACIFGALLVFFTIRLAMRLSRSILVGAIAGILLTFDGLAFVMSRIALLDIFQATFAVAAVAALVADRDYFRRQLAHHLRKRGLTDLGGTFGPIVLWRPWRILAGLCFGASCAVKWNTIYMIAVFGILTVIWDLSARRLAGAGRNSSWSLAADAIPAFIHLVVVAIPAYLAAWYRWLSTPGGWARDWGAAHPGDPVVQRLGSALGSLWHYHVQMFQFHTGQGIKDAQHPYDAHPLGWPFMVRPIGIYAPPAIRPPDEGCTAVATTCVRIISGMGTPILWWLAALALGAACWWWLRGRDWRFGVPVLGVAATWLPWFQYTERPLFFFYAIMLIPFSATALALCLGRLLGPARGPHRRTRAIGVGLAVTAVVAHFAFLYPILTGALLTRIEWSVRMWLATWV